MYRILNWQYFCLVLWSTHFLQFLIFTCWKAIYVFNGNVSLDAFKILYLKFNSFTMICLCGFLYISLLGVIELHTEVFNIGGGGNLKYYISKYCFGLIFLFSFLLFSKIQSTVILGLFCYIPFLSFICFCKIQAFISMP